MEKKQKVVVVFGVFDIIHDGHRHFLRQAKKLGTRLVAVVAQDRSVLALKGRLPYYSIEKRLENLKSEGLADAVAVGDETLGSWNILTLLQPDVIALGYDQQKLAEALKPAIKKMANQATAVFIEAYSDPSLHSKALRACSKSNRLN